MALFHKKIFINKLVRRIYYEKTRIWQFLPTSFFISRTTSKFLNSFNRTKLKNIFDKVLGDFNEGELKLSKNDCDTIIELADKTVAHYFDYLGSGLIQLDPINWHIDFISGFEWTKGLFYRKYIQVDPNNNADVKIPRELSRCHHLLWLGEAYMITKDNKYSDEIVNEIDNWIDENEFLYSINWCCAMDVGIRAVNWMYAVNMIIDSNRLTDFFVRKLVKSLYEHGLYIYGNFEKGIPYSNNHYASDVVCLLFISQLFRNTKSGELWWKYSLSEYYSEAREQILPSGVHFEKSISYHRMMTEFFMYTYAMLKRTEMYVPIDIVARIESMVLFINDYIKPNGLSPLIGDNDDGRFLPFIRYDFRDHSYLLNIGRKLFGNDADKIKKLQTTADEFFILNDFISFSNDSVIKNELPTLYKDAGIFLFKSDYLYLIFYNTGLCKYGMPSNNQIGTHSHADLLSFELAINGEDIFIDPGTYVYTSDIKARNDFRSTKKHNTVVIDGNDQYVIDNMNAFSGSHFPFVDTLGWHKRDRSHSCKGCYRMSVNGFQCFHERKIDITEKEIRIKDIVKNKGKHEMQIFFHLAEGLDATTHENGFTIYSINNEVKIIFDCKIEYMIKINKDSLSPSYGILRESKTLEMNLSFTDNIDLSSTIIWN